MKNGNWGALLASLICFSGCERQARIETRCEPPPAVAEYGGVRITLTELDASIRDELYRLRGEGLYELLMQRLEKLEADKHGIGVKELRAKAVDSLIEPPSEEKLREFFANAERQGVLTPESTFESARPEIVEMLTISARRELHEKYLDELLMAHGVRMNFDVLGRPRLTFRDGGPSVGPDDAPITIVEFTDFKRRAGQNNHETLKRVIAEYPKRVRVVFRHKPESNDAAAQRAAESALCAHDQGRYWDFRTSLFAHRGEFATEQLAEYAGQVGLDVERFRHCVETRKHRAAVEADIAEAQRHGLESIPATALNGAPVNGLHDFRFYRRLIEVEMPSFRRLSTGEPPKNSPVARAR